MLANAAFNICLATIFVLRTTIQGMGYSSVAMFNGIFEMVARGVAGLFIVPAIGFTAACFASPIAWVMADCYLIPAYLYVMRKAQRGRLSAQAESSAP